MKVYPIKTTNNFNDAIMTFVVIVMILPLPLVISIYTYLTVGDWSKWLIEYTMLIPLNIIFFLGGLYFIIMVLKKPKKYIGKLIAKEKDKKGHWLMHFEVDKYKINEMFCYTKEENNFIVGNEYFLYIKEIYEKIISVSEPDDTLHDENKDSVFDKAVNNKNFNLYLGFLSCSFFMIFGICACIVALFIWPEYSKVYLLAIVMIIIALHRLYKVFKDHKQ